MKKLALLLIALFSLSISLQAQTELAATLEVINAGVEVQRVNTSNRIPINIETIVGVGDTIFTSGTGAARVTFFADGTATELTPNTIYRIDNFTSGSNQSFNLQVSVLLGITQQQLGRVLDANSSYEVQTPGMTLAARGTVFDVRVEQNRRSAMIVRESTVDVAGNDSAASSAQVDGGFGIRAESGRELSDVVRATNFAELDAALDGCRLGVTTGDDVTLNLRLGPSIDSQRVGFEDATRIGIVVGVSDSGGWYRVAFAGGHAWFLSSSAEIVGNCAGLRVFPDNHLEDASKYTGTATLPVLITPVPPSSEESTTDESSGD